MAEGAAGGESAGVGTAVAAAIEVVSFHAGKILLRSPGAILGG